MGVNIALSTKDFWPRISQFISWNPPESAPFVLIRHTCSEEFPLSGQGSFLSLPSKSSAPCKERFTAFLCVYYFRRDLISATPQWMGLLTVEAVSAFAHAHEQQKYSASLNTHILDLN